MSGSEGHGAVGHDAAGQGTAGQGTVGRDAVGQDGDGAGQDGGPVGAGGVSGPGGGPGSGPGVGAGPGPGPGRGVSGRAQVRVVRPGGSGLRDGGIPPMPVAPPSILPPWLTAAAAAPAPGAQAPPRTTGTPGTPGAAATAEQPVLSPGEAELRELLQRSVSGLQPATGSLETLRRAVPLRRARRRRCGGVVGALVLGVLGGLALHSLADAGGSAQGSQSGPGYQNAATASAAGSAGATPSGSTAVPGLPPPTGTGGSLPPLTGAGVPSGAPSGSRSGSVAPDPPGSSVSGSGPGGGATAAECTRAQLGGGAATVGSAGANGTTYGSFQVANVSQSTCQVSLSGTVTVVSTSGTSASRIAVVQHSASDPATQLPPPSATPSPVLLAPGQSYAVDFAWVPAAGAGAPSCTDDSASASPSASPTAGDGGDPTGAVGSESASDSQAAPPSTSPPPGGDPSITLAQIPGAGGPPAVSAVLPDACAGTVYDTPPLATG